MIIIRKAMMTVFFVGFLLLFLTPKQIFAAEVRVLDQKSPREGNTFVYVRGLIMTESKETILGLINSYRKEACEKGYPNPDAPGKSLTPADYVPIRWSADLEWIAQTRAAEGAVYDSHTRPNNLSCFSLKHNNTSANYEDLAWGSDLLGGIKMWYTEKMDWIHQTGAVTGHYTSMIAPSVRYVGIGFFGILYNPGGGEDIGIYGWPCTAGEFSSALCEDESQTGVPGEYYQQMEVDKTQKLLWESGDPSIATVDQNGTIKGIKPGSVTITVSNGDYVENLHVDVLPNPKAGELLTYKENIYKVTSIEAKAFKNNKHLTSVNIPKNVNKIGSEAFYGCKNLKELKISTTKLTSKKIGKAAFKNAGAGKGKKLTVKVPGSKRSTYKTLLRKKGLSKKSAVK